MEDSYQVIDSVPGAPGHSRSVLTIITRRKWIIVQITAVAVLLAWAVALLQPRTYKAEAWMVMSAPAKSSDKDATAQADPWTQLQGDMSTHFRLMRSMEVAQAVATELETAVPLGALAMGLTPQKMAGTSANLITLTYQSEDPLFAQRVATAWAKAYQAYSLNRTNSGTNAAIEYVEEQIATVEQQLREIEQQIARLEQEFLTSGIGSGGGSAAASLNGMISSLASARVEEAALRAQIAQTQGQLAAEPEKVQETEEQPTIGAKVAQDQLAQLSVRLEQMRVDYYEDSPEVTGLKEQIARLEEQLANQSEMTKTLVKTVTNPTHLKKSDELIGLRAQLTALEARASKLQQQIDSQRRVANEVPPTNIRYTELSRKVQALGAVHATLLSQFYDLQLKKAMAVPAVQMIKEADLPTSPVEPPMRTIIGLGLLAGLLLSLVVAVIVDQLDDTFANAVEVGETLEHRLIGSLPQYGEGMGSGLPIVDQPRGIFANAARKLASTTRIELDRNHLHSLVVTSAIRGEGKSVVAANLAVALARAGTNVLLVDANLHEPVLHNVFDLSNDAGLADVLIGKATLADVQRQTGVENLRLLPAGPSPLAPVDLLAGEAGEQAIREINRSAAIVLWDTPPAATLADATVLGTLTDRTLLVIGRRTKRSVVRDTLRNLQALGVRLLGVAANQMGSSDEGYYHYYAGSDTQETEKAS